MTKEQKQTEELVKRYIRSLDEQYDKLIALNGANSGFDRIQDSFANSFTDCINKAKKRLLEIKDGAVWDNLVIAFFGETNAGKSTIIETFRILFGEEERTSNLKKNPEGVDGLIVGTGHVDPTVEGSPVKGGTCTITWAAPAGTDGAYAVLPPSC